jgi:hypothetical protein
MLLTIMDPKCCTASRSLPMNMLSAIKCLEVMIVRKRVTPMDDIVVWNLGYYSARCW